MSNADKIGLLPGFGWLAGHGLLQTMAFCLAITPGMMFVIGVIGESRILPVTPDKQFVSFVPGDLFLSMAAALLLWRASSLPAESRWYNSTTWHVIVLMAAIVVAIVMTWMEWKSGVYSTRAIFSPTKLYHNGILYGGYGYVIVTTLVALIFGAGDRWWLSALLPGLIWVYLLAVDNTGLPKVKESRAAHAHDPNWKPIWSR